MKIGESNTLKGFCKQGHVQLKFSNAAPNKSRWNVVQGEPESASSNNRSAQTTTMISAAMSMTSPDYVDMMIS